MAILASTLRWEVCMLISSSKPQSLSHGGTIFTWFRIHEQTWQIFVVSVKLCCCSEWLACLAKSSGYFSATTPYLHPLSEGKFFGFKKFEHLFKNSTIENLSAFNTNTSYSMGKAMKYPSESLFIKKACEIQDIFSPAS